MSIRDDETWHRLLVWTRGQTPSERLAAQLLLDEGFTDLDPSHPLGGPDGGKDAVACRGGRTWVMAVYFPRDQQPFADIRKKFVADFRGVGRNAADGMVFVTNQEISLSERAQLKASVDGPTELYHLERIAILLDQPRLAAVRHQFLLIDAQTAPQSGTVCMEGWAGRVFGSSLWTHVTNDVDLYQSHACVAAENAERLVTDLRQKLVCDPWLEADFSTRHLERIEWLWSERPPELSAAEAAILVLLPFLRQANTVRFATEHLEVNPAQLGRRSEDTASSRSFGVFTDSHDVLVHRTRLRPGSEAPIGWWLFHRWLSQQESIVDPVRIAQLLRDIGAPLSDLGETFAVERVSSLLHGLRLGTGVCHPEYLAALPFDDHIRAPGRQRLRTQRLALISALACTAAIEATALPDVVGQHLGIPDAVDPASVLATLDEAVWGGSHELPVLRAACHHEAVVEGLREYTESADELLHDVRQLVRERITQPMPELPTRLSADGVGPAAGTFDGWAKFRLDQHRVRDLLMGVQLYKDPDLAVRELYQNALDACRYRAARTEYLNRTQPADYSYVGAISFVQGSEGGREYLECTDNGIGMGENELRGVFSNAGARFPGQTEFRREWAAWKHLDPPIPFHPNSRFGIGVFSYFMLADEIRVTTCRLGLDGTPGQLLEVSIHGPGHLFRIVRLAECGNKPGTRIRLYLRGNLGGDNPWSCVDVLTRLLAVAEFETSAQRGEQTATWRPGELRLRPVITGGRFGLHASGAVAEWDDSPDGCQVFWCEHGGALLVDGLIVHPAQRRGVCAGRDSTLRGVVVNLFGAYAPEQLSVDRTELVDDMSDMVEKLLVDAAEELVASDSELPSYEWICTVADQSPVIADVLTKACINARRSLYFGDRQIDVARTGCLSSDRPFLTEVARITVQVAQARHGHADGVVAGEMLDHVVLWRLLAHRPNRTLDELTESCPELATFDAPRPPVPSDQILYADFPSDRMDYPHWRDESASKRSVLNDMVSALGCTVDEAESRIVEFGVSFDDDETFSQDEEDKPCSSLPEGASEADRMWFEETFSRETFVPPGPVKYFHVLELAERLDLHINDVVARLRCYGFNLNLCVPDTLTDVERRLLKPNIEWWYFPDNEAMPFAYIVVAAHRLHISPSELVTRIRSYGVKISCSELPENLTFDGALRLLKWDEREDGYLEHDRTISLYWLIDRARKEHASVGQVVDWLREMGIQLPALGDSIRSALARVPRV